MLDKKNIIINTLKQTLEEIARYETWEWDKIKNTDKFCVLFTSLAREGLDKITTIKTGE